MSENFNAVLWMQEVMQILVHSEADIEKTNYRSHGQTLSTQSRSLVYRPKIPMKERKYRCHEGCREATKYVLKH